MWKCGKYGSVVSMAVWKSGSVEVWQCGSLVVWKSGSVEVSYNGSMAVW